MLSRDREKQLSELELKIAEIEDLDINEKESALSEIKRVQKEHKLVTENLRDAKI